MNRNLESLLRWGSEPSLCSFRTPADPLLYITGIENSVQEDNGNPTQPASSSSAPSSTSIVPFPYSSASSTSIPPPRSSEDPARPFTSKLDPKILDAILGKSDAQRMLECVQNLKSEGKYSLDQKLDLWDELELLVESLDNANDLENMKLWEPLVSFLSDPIEEMRLQSCWVLGTAIQNNIKSQAAFLKFDPIPKLLDLLQTGKSSELRSKAMYTLSGSLRHNRAAVERFTALEGWNTLNNALQDPSITLRRKSAFLINSLITNASSQNGETVKMAHAAQVVGIQNTLLFSLIKETAIPHGANGEVEDIDEDYSDKAIQILMTLVDKVGIIEAFSEQQRSKLKVLVKEIASDKRIPSDLAESEWVAFGKAVEA